MTRIVHLTDLHFGSERRDLVGPLGDALRAVQPGLVVVTGDLSHRARAAQFRQAVGFLRGLGLPFMVVPGNHDLPVLNPLARLLDPFGSWRGQVAADPAPVVAVGDMRVFGANTADPYRWRRGILRATDVRRIEAELARGAGGAINVLACHHPFVEPPGFERGETKGARDALPGLIRAGIGVILTGHLHNWEIGLGVTEASPQPVLMVQTGTALCDREGERDHGFSVLEARGGRLTVTPWRVGDAAPRFAPDGTRCFERVDGAWHLLGQAREPYEGQGLG